MQRKHFAILAIDNRIDLEAKASAPASSLVDNRPASEHRGSISTGGGGREGRTGCESGERELTEGGAGTRRGTRKEPIALCQGSPIQEQLRDWKRETGREAGGPEKDQEEGTSRPALSVLKSEKAVLRNRLFFYARSAPVRRFDRK